MPAHTGGGAVRDGRAQAANISFTEAAGLPTAYVTAYYALHTLAGIKAGDRVLIHAAAGGVGQAAVALAKLAGAEIFATASPGKQDFLRAQGIEHVLNSRTLDFAEEIMERTGGAGVDIVLNSLNNDYISAGIGVLAAGGRLRRARQDRRLVAGAGRARPAPTSATTTSISASSPSSSSSASTSGFWEVVGLLEDGSIAPIVSTSYSPDEIEEAFSVLSRGANIGKLVIDLREPDAIGSRPEPALRPNETYLITGGLGALGLVTAQKLVEEGARHLSVLSRRDADADADAAAAAALQARLGEDVRLVFHRGDIADAADVERIMAAIAGGGHPLGGIVHAAGVLADGPVATMTWEQIDKVFRAKVYGTWLLHEAAGKCAGMRFFVGYSSIASVLGPFRPGQLRRGQRVHRLADDVARGARRAWTGRRLGTVGRGGHGGEPLRPAGPGDRGLRGCVSSSRASAPGRCGRCSGSPPATC